MRRPGTFLKHWLESGAAVWVVVLALVVVAMTGSDGFATAANLANVGRQSAVLLLVCLAQFLVVLVSGVDLSLGANVRLTAIVAAIVMNGTDTGLVPGIVAALAVGAAIGLFNGIGVALLRLEPFIATLGTQALLLGLALYVASTPKGRVSPALTSFYDARLGGVYLVTLVALAVWGLAWVALQRTGWGRHVYAVGGAADVAMVSGIAVTRVRIVVYTLAGVLGGLAGVLTVAGSGVGDPNAATGLEFLALAVVVIGGASLAGGRGTLFGALGGVALFAVLGNVFTLLRVDIWYQQGLRGLIILVAAGLYIGPRVSGARRAARTRPAPSTSSTTTA